MMTAFEDQAATIKSFESGKQRMDTTSQSLYSSLTHEDWSTAGAAKREPAGFLGLHRDSLNVGDIWTDRAGLIRVSGKEESYGFAKTDGGMYPLPGSEIDDPITRRAVANVTKTMTPEQREAVVKAGEEYSEESKKWFAHWALGTGGLLGVGPKEPPLPPVLRDYYNKVAKEKERISEQVDRM